MASMDQEPQTNSHVMRTIKQYGFNWQSSHFLNKNNKIILIIFHRQAKQEPSVLFFFSLFFFLFLLASFYLSRSYSLTFRCRYQRNYRPPQRQNAAILYVITKGSNCHHASIWCRRQRLAAFDSIAAAWVQASHCRPSRFHAEAGRRLTLQMRWEEG